MVAKNELSEKTRVPMSFLLTLVGIVVAIVLWGKGLEGQVEAHVISDERTDAQVLTEIKEIRKDFRNIDSRLSRIEGKLELPQKQGR